MYDNRVFKRNLRWLITLRWVGIGIALVVSAAAKRLGYIPSSLAPLYGILLFPILCNLLFTWQIRHGRAGSYGTILAQIFADQFTLAGLVSISGTCHSPFLFFFLFHVVISGILLPYRYTILVATCAAALPLATIGIRHFWQFPHYDLFNHAASSYADWDTIVTHGVAFCITLTLTTYFSVYLSRELQRSREDLAEKNEKLSVLVQSSRAAASPHERNVIATESFRAILKDEKARAEIILLDDAPPGPSCSDFFGCKQANCPAYKTGTNCWTLSGTHCRSHVEISEPLPGRPVAIAGAGNAVRNRSDDLSACFHCNYFLQTAAALSSNDPSCDGPGTPQPREGAEAVRLALRNGLRARHHSGGFQAVSNAAFPLMMHDSLSGLLFISSSAATITEDMTEFITLFSELTSSGLIGSNMIDAVETSYLQTVMALANAIEAKDPYTKGHSQRVAYYSIRLADALGLTKQEKEHLSFAAILHDVGKIGVSEEVLLKTARLTGQEQEIMRTHPEIGARILEPVHFLKPAISAIKHHHEQYDGSGYPGGLQGAEIPFKARIINVADAWDAMTSDRAYRKALPRETAIRELMRHAGKQFDREITEVFVELIVAGRCA